MNKRKDKDVQNGRNFYKNYIYLYKQLRKSLPESRILTRICITTSTRPHFSALALALFARRSANAARRERVVGEDVVQIAKA